MISKEMQRAINRVDLKELKALVKVSYKLETRLTILKTIQDKQEK